MMGDLFDEETDQDTLFLIDKIISKNSKRKAHLAVVSSKCERQRVTLMNETKRRKKVGSVALVSKDGLQNSSDILIELE